MDQQELQQKIALYYSKLPKDMQEMFSSMKWLEDLRQISIKYELREEQIRNLGTETTLVLLGIIPIEEYEAFIVSELKLREDTLRQMVLEIEEKVLGQFRAGAKEAYLKNISEKGEEQLKVEEKLSENFKKFPRVIQDAIDESDYQQTLYQIADEQNLNIRELGQLEELTTSVMLNTLPGEQFEGSIRRNLQTSPEKAALIVQQVNERILRKIKDTMIGVKKEDRTDTEVLSQAGIKIVTKPIERIFASPTSPAPKPAIPATPIGVPKLSQSFQMTKTKTEYSLNNITKTPDIIAKEKQKLAPAPGATPKAAPTPTMSDVKVADPKPASSYHNGSDPYRLSPDK